MAVSNKGDFRELFQKLPHMQCLKLRIELGALLLSCYLTILDITIVFPLLRDLKHVDFDLSPQLRLLLVSNGEIIFLRYCNVHV